MVDTQNTMPAASTAIPADPLLAAIKAYRDGLAAYDAADETPEHDDSALLAATVLGPHETLTNWRSPATSEEAARAAMALAEEERAKFGESPVADAMEAAAIGFWK